MFRRMSLRLSVLLSFLAILTGSAKAQTTGSIAGTVKDSSGAVLAGATVTVTGPSLQRESLSATTSEEGAYRLLLIPAGVYDVVAELSGFSVQTRKSIEVALNQQTTLDFTMALAGVSESVQVQAAAPVVETTRSDVTNRVTARTIDALPLNGRNFVDLIALVPGARPDPALSGQNISIFGERGGAVSFLVDGAENNDPTSGGPVLRFTQDSIKEFEVVTTGYEAEFGRAQGGVANIVTRSGTDDFIGRAFLFGRNDRFDESNVENQQPPRLRREQWGGTLGGPIKRDRAFFFGSFEKLNEDRGVNINRARIPAFVLSGIATPQGEEDFSIAPNTDGFTSLGKADVSITTNNRLSASVNRSQQDTAGEISSPVAGTVALPSAARTGTIRATSAVIRETAIFSASTFLETTGTFVRGQNGTNLDQTRRSEPLLLLLSGSNGGFLQTGAPFGGRTDRVSDRTQVGQSLTRFVSGGGDHQLKFGWDFNHVTLTGSNDVTNDVEYSAAFLSPNAPAVMSDLFTRFGFAQSAARFFTLSSSPDGRLDIDITDNSLSFFGQDAWHPRADVTVNAGARFDYSSLFGDDKNNVAPRAGVAWDVGDRHRTIVKANWGLFYDRNLLGSAATVPEKGGVFTKSAFDVALPRLGVDYSDSLIDLVITSGFPIGGGNRTPAENPAYRPVADALRTDPLALYGLLGIDVANRDNPPIVTADNVQGLSGKTPAQVIALLDATYPGTDWQFFDVPGGSIVGDRVLSFFPRGPLAQTRDVSRYAEDRTPWTVAFSAGVDQQIGLNLSVTAAYVHRRTRDLLTRRIVNLFDVPPGDPNFGGTTDGGPRISQVGYDGRINYDGVILAARKRFSDRYQFGVSYTGSRSRDNLLTSAVGVSGDVASTFSNNNHPEIDFGPSNQSVPHIFVANGVVMLPLDLNVSGIVFWRSGSAFNPRGLQDLDGDGLVDQRDTTEPRNRFRTDPYADLDLRVEKRVRLSGRHAVTFLVEAFNLTNRANVANVNAVAGTRFGEPVAFLPGREVQFGVRYLFGPQ